MSKKIISVLLAVVMLVAMGTVAIVSTSAFGPLPEKADGTNRYYLYMPEQWYNDYAYTAGVYWWEGTDAHSSWPGIEALEGDVEGVYYYDVPQDVTSIVWNNYVDGGTDKSLDIYRAACQTKNIGTEYYDPGDSDLYPDGTDSFDEMIYVVDLSQTEVSEYSGKMTYIGEWYYYYGNGEYGTAKDKADAEVVYTDRAFNADKMVTEPIETETATESTPIETTATETTATETTVTQATDATEITTATTPIADAEQFGTVVDGTQYLTTVGDILTYTFELKTPANIENVQATVKYDADKLELVYPEGKDKLDQRACFPVLRDVAAVTVNSSIAGAVKFNASEGVDTGFDFTAGGTLVTLQFKVLDNSADSAITTEIEEMCEFETSDEYYTGSDKVNEAVVTTETLTGNTVPPTPTKPTDPVESSTASKPVETSTASKPVETATASKPVETATASKPVETATATATGTGAGTTPAPNTSDATGATGSNGGSNGTVTTGAAAYIYVVFAVLAMAAGAVVVLRKKANG